MVALELVQAVAATTCRSQWRRDARALGSPPLCSLGSTHAVWRVLLPVALGTHSLWVASPGVMSEPPASLVGFGVAALFSFHHCTVAGVSGPAIPRVPTPRLLGVTKEWR